MPKTNVFVAGPRVEAEAFLVDSSVQRTGHL
jgi:hypothetical protein